MLCHQAQGSTRGSSRRAAPLTAHTPPEPSFAKIKQAPELERACCTQSGAWLRASKPVCTRCTVTDRCGFWHCPPDVAAQPRTACVAALRCCCWCGQHPTGLGLRQLRDCLSGTCPVSVSLRFGSMRCSPSRCLLLAGCVNSINAFDVVSCLRENGKLYEMCVCGGLMQAFGC